MQGKILLSILMVSVMCLHFSMQKEDILEHINAKVSLVCTRDTNELTHAKILVNTLECQVS